MLGACVEGGGASSMPACQQVRERRSRKMRPAYQQVITHWCGVGVQLQQQQQMYLLGMLV